MVIRKSKKENQGRVTSSLAPKVVRSEVQERTVPGEGREKEGSNGMYRGTPLRRILWCKKQ